MRLPIKAFRGGRSNRCILTVQRLCRNAPAICGPLLLYLQDKHFRVRHPERPLRGRLATARAHTTPPGLRGAGVGDAPPRWLAQPRGLSGNRRRARAERGKHEERGFLRAETGVDIVGEGGCGRWRGRGGRPVDPGVLPARQAFPRSSFLTAPGSWAVTHSLSSSRAPQPLGPQEGTIPIRLPGSVVNNKRVATALQSVAATGGWRVGFHSHWITDDWLLPAGVVQDWLAIIPDRNPTVFLASFFSSVNSWFSKPGLVFL